MVMPQIYPGRVDWVGINKITIRTSRGIKIDCKRFPGDFKRGDNIEYMLDFSEKHVINIFKEGTIDTIEVMTTETGEQHEDLMEWENDIYYDEEEGTIGCM